METSENVDYSCCFQEVWLSLLFIWISCLLPSAPAALQCTVNPAAVQCTVWSCYCTIHSQLLLLYSEKSAISTVQCTVHSLFLLPYSAQSAPATVQSTVCSCCCTVYSLLLLLYIAQPNPATVQCTVYYNCCCTLRAIRRDFTGTVFFWYLIAFILYLMSPIYCVFTFYA